jgi:hypothetical protein
MQESLKEFDEVENVDMDFLKVLRTYVRTSNKCITSAFGLD